MIKKFIRDILLGEKANSAKYVKYLKNKGVQIGEKVHFYSPANTLVDLTCPWLITIGNNVSITHGVIILTHDYSWSVIKELSATKGAVFGAQSPVSIGNNVFIGMNAIITRGVTIGDNVIIGAGSVVTTDCESNCVYAGIPAKKIMTIEEFALKREKKQFEEAKRMALLYKEKFKKDPPKEVFFEYFMLFSTPQEAMQIESFRSRMETGCGFDECVAYMHSHPPIFENYEAFLKECYQ